MQLCNCTSCAQSCFILLSHATQTVKPSHDCASCKPLSCHSQGSVHPLTASALEGEDSPPVNPNLRGRVLKGALCVTVEQVLLTIHPKTRGCTSPPPNFRGMGCQALGLMLLLLRCWSSMFLLHGRMGLRYA